MALVLSTALYKCFYQGELNSEHIHKWPHPLFSSWSLTISVIFWGLLCLPFTSQKMLTLKLWTQTFYCPTTHFRNAHIELEKCSDHPKTYNPVKKAVLTPMHCRHKHVDENNASKTRDTHRDSAEFAEVMFKCPQKHKQAACKCQLKFALHISSKTCL